jgi:hypothetical protein
LNSRTGSAWNQHRAMRNYLFAVMNGDNQGRSVHLNPIRKYRKRRDGATHGRRLYASVGETDHKKERSRSRGPGRYDARSARRMLLERGAWSFSKGVPVIGDIATLTGRRSTPCRLRPRPQGRSEGHRAIAKLRR